MVLFVVHTHQRGGMPYQLLKVPEHSPPGTVVGNITRAVDADEGSNAVVYYFIAGEAATLGLVCYAAVYEQNGTNKC